MIKVVLRLSTVPSSLKIVKPELVPTKIVGIGNPVALLTGAFGITFISIACINLFPRDVEYCLGDFPVMLRSAIVLAK